MYELNEIYDFGQTLTAHRMSLNVTAHEMAKRLGASQKAVVSWEMSEAFPCEVWLVFVAWNYKISLDVLMEK